tara:strand:- start:1249 stop:1923 length:675 start_codon:yes stop_codon:yes gene_type:complete
MNNITIGITYYDNYEALKKVIHYYESWDNYKFIIVDDGSPKRPLEKNDIPNDWSLYRVTKDIGWNNEGCRNLIVHECETEWICLTDIDHVILDVDLYFDNHDKNTIYFFKDLYKPVGKNVISGRKPYNHNQIYTTKKYFLEVGGYDETYAGYYGQDGSLIASPHIRYNISEYCVDYNQNKNGIHFGQTDNNRKNLLGRGTENKWRIPEKTQHNKKLTFPWIKIK